MCLSLFISKAAALRPVFLFEKRLGYSRFPVYFVKLFRTNLASLPTIHVVKLCVIGVLEVVKIPVLLRLKILEICLERTFYFSE